MHTKADVFGGFSAGVCLAAALTNAAAGRWWVVALLVLLAGTNLALSFRSWGRA